MKAGLTITDSDKLEDFLGGTVLSVEEAKNQFLKNAANKTKAAVHRHIPRSMGKRRHTGRKPLHQDIQAGLVDDKVYGGKRARVRGGRHTGPLWHIVDQGTRRSRGRNFMSKAMADVEGGLDAALDIALSEEFGK